MTNEDLAQEIIDLASTFNCTRKRDKINIIVFSDRTYTVNITDPNDFNKDKNPLATLCFNNNYVSIEVIHTTVLDSLNEWFKEE